MWSTSSTGTFSNVGSNGTSQTYVVASTYVNDYLKVVITASNSCGSGCGSASATSGASSVVKGVSPTAGSAAVSGTAQSGQTLTASPSGFSLGTPAATYSYQWQSSPDGSTWTNISSATASTYVIGSSLVNDYVRVVITATNTCSSGCGSASATSGASSQILPAAPSGGSAAISGTVQVGQTLTASTSGWSPSTPTPTYSYQWQVSATGTSGWANATGTGNATSSYTVAAADYNQYLRVQVTATNPGGSGTATSPATSQVLPLPPTGGTASVSGTAQVGQVLSASTSGWSPSTPTPTYSYQWQVSANGTSGWANASGSGATTASYTIASADGGQYLRVTVTASNPGGSGGASSAATGQVLTPVSGGSVQTNGTQSQTVTISSSLSLIQFTFSGTAGQQIYLEWSGNGFYYYDKTKLYDPNGLQLVSADWGDNALSRFILPGTGTYTVDVFPSSGATSFPASAYLNIWVDPPDVNGGTLPADGLSHSFNITTPGQYGYFTFNGTAGQTFWAEPTGGEYTGVGQSVYLYTPDGNLWQTTSGGGGFDKQLLPQTGTYKLVYEPNQCPCASDLTGSKSFALNLPVPADDGGWMPINSTSPIEVDANQGGKRAWRVFYGMAGQPVTVSWSGFYYYSKVSIYQLNMQGQIVSTLWGPNDFGDGTAGTLTLPATGPYVVFVNPQQTPYQIFTGTGSITIGSPWVVPQQQEKGCDAAGNGTNNSAFMGDVNTLTGTYSTSVTDISLPGLGIPLTFSRCYSSAYANVNSALGYGWNNSFGAKLVIDGSGNATLTDENNQIVSYTKNADGSYSSGFSSSNLTKLGDGTYQLVKHGGATYHFDANGNLLSVKDRNGEGLRYAYDGSGQLTSVTDQEGRTATVNYNADGTIHSVSFQDGRSVGFTYTNGNLTSVTDVRGKTWTYAYDGNHQLTSVQDPNLNYPIRNTYTNGQITQQEDANGNTRTFSYSSNFTLNATISGIPVNATVNDPQTTTMTDAAGKTWTDTYADNELVSRTDPLGNTTSYTYDGSGNKLTSTDPKGHVTTMTYDGNGNMLTLAAPSSLGYPQQVWTYNSMNEVLTHKDMRGNTTTYNYDANGNLTSIVKPGTLTTTLNLDPSNPELVDSVQDARGYTTNYAYNNLNELTAVTDPDGNETTYGYDSAGRRTTVTSPRGNTTSCQTTQGCPAQYTTTTVYDPAGNKLSVTDGLGNQTTYTYDPAGNLQTMVDPVGNTTSCQNTQGCPAQHTTSYGYTNANQLTSVTPPGAPASTISYDSRGLVQSRTDAIGDKTSYTYNDAGELKTVVSPNGNTSSCQNTQGCPAQYTTTFSYDGDGNRASVVNPLGGETDFTYDPLDRLTQKVVHGAQAGTETTGYSYDPNGNLAQVVDPMGRTTTMTYTALNQLQTRVSPLGNTTSCQNTTGCPAQYTTTYAYNNDGKLNSVTGPTPMSSTTTYNYDNADLLQSMVAPLGNVSGCGCASQYTTTYAYDPDGNLHTVTDPNQHTTTTNYDADERPVNTYDPLSRETQWQYDPNGNLVKRIANDQSFTLYGYNQLNQLTSVQDARGYTTTITPNAAGEVTQTQDPIGDTTTFTYDANGNQLTSEDAIANNANNPSLGTTSLTFNAMDEPTNVSYSDGTHSVGYGYDTQGNPTSRTDAQGTTNYTLNLDNQVTAATLGGSGFTYGYDMNGRLNSESYPNGTSVTLGYDANSNLNLVSSGGQSTSYVYDASNELTSETLPSGNGYVATLAYDNAGQLNTIVNKKGASTLSSYTVAQRYADGAPETVNAQNNDQSWTETYTYDSVGRLASVCYQASCPNSSDPKISWVYDADGNRQTETRANNVVTTYQYNHADQLQSATRGSTTTNYVYDKDGRETAAGSSSYNWNLAGEMTSATVGGATTSYTYDGAGMRTSSTTGASTINYTWDEADGALPTLASEATGSGAALRTYIYGASSSPVSMTTPGGSYYYHYDDAGNVSDLTSSTGATQWAYQYEPFGLLRSSTNVSGNAPTNPFQFAGQYTDTSTGLSDLRARQYDPSTAAFLSTDPAGVSTVMASSPYAYANDQPLSYADPSGLCSICTDIGNAVSTGLHYAYDFVVQPFVQTAQDDWACVSRQTHCAAAAFNTGLMLLPVEGVLGKDIALAASEASRGALRDVATSIGERVTGGLYRLATEETGSVDLSRLAALTVDRGYERAAATGAHFDAVSEYASQIATGMEGFTSERLASVRIGGMLHDIGKLAWPQGDPGLIGMTRKITSAEFEKYIIPHPEVGSEMLTSLGVTDQDVLDMTLWHHLKYGGGGYPTIGPDGLAAPVGEDIPLVSRITTVADSFHAMIDPLRSYKTPMTAEEAWQELQANAGSQFDPNVVDKFGSVLGFNP
jgi:RHS repeat-associated protein